MCSNDPKEDSVILSNLLKILIPMLFLYWCISFNLCRGKDVALALTKKRKLDVDPQRDNYQPIPMDVEDEYGKFSFSSSEEFRRMFSVTGFTFCLIFLKVTVCRQQYNKWQSVLKEYELKGKGSVGTCNIFSAKFCMTI